MSSSIHPRQHNHASQSAAAGVPTYFHMQKTFWAFVGTAIGVAILANVLNQILYRQRISAIRNVSHPAKPRSLFFKAHATLSAVVREAGYYSPPLSFRKTHYHLPPIGPVLMVVAYVILIVVCSLYRFNTKSFLQWESIGYRSGFIAVSQMPLIILLAGKRNILGFFTGMGYERLAWLHRWVARALLFTVLIHLGYWFSVWNRFDYAMVKMQTDPLTQRGLAAGGVLGWIVFSSVAPVRGLSYEFFVVQHIISWLGFFVALYFHIPPENKIWIWLPLGFWAFDRVVRAGYLFYNNLSIFHKGKSGVLACKATFEPVGETHTRIVISNPPVTWKAGQHMVLACHPLAPLSSHPFTITSLPEDGRMEFLVQSKKGATRRFLSYASKIYTSLPRSTAPAEGRSVLIEGPYSRIRPLRQFDSVIFVAGSTGATFTVPLLRDIVLQWSGKSTRQRFDAPVGAVTRRIRFIWVVKHRSSIAWFADQLNTVTRDVEALRNEGKDVSLDISIYVTCDDTITNGQSTPPHEKQTAAELTNLSLSTSRDEKKESVTMLENITSRASSTEEECCCKRVIADEDAITHPCNCGAKNKQPQLQRGGCSSGSSITAEKEKFPSLVDARIPLLSGRPHVPNLIRKQAELAWGEMAVVVCGPKALIQCARNAAATISDDRAVHKGTGAQGIYVHAECFGYA